MHTLCNVLLIVIDALRADHLGCYGYGRETSPHIDAIAREGVRFDTVISQSSWTKPSVASLLTSTYPDVHGVKQVDDILSVQDTLLPVILKNVGYSTGCIQTNPFLSAESGFRQGFDYYVELFDKTPGVYKPRMDEASAVLLELLERLKGSPFFLYLHVLDTHNPYRPPEVFRRFGNSEEDLFDGEISFVDYYIGIVREYLSQEGLREKTILVITSDHGEEFGEHGQKYHAKHLYQEVLKIPLIISGPGFIPSELSIPAQVRSIDIAPTILEMLGLPTLEHHQGASLIPLLVNEESAVRPALSQIGSGAPGTKGDEIVSLNSGEYKLIWSRGDEITQLHHLPSDPGERHDLALQETEVVHQLKRQAEKLIALPEEERSRYKGKPAKVELDNEVLDRLRALGYMA
jgi:arylsulfatase A-like enzyme